MGLVSPAVNMLQTDAVWSTQLQSVESCTNAGPLIPDL